MTLETFKSAARPLLKYVASLLLIPVVLDGNFDSHKFDAFLMFLAGLYGIRSVEKVADKQVSKPQS